MYRYDRTDRISRDLAALEDHRRQLDDRGVLSRRWEGRLRRELQADAVAASTSLEGVPVSSDDVRRILVGDRPQGVTPADAALVRGYEEAMSYVLRLADAESFSWQSELIRAIQDRVLAGSFAAGAGRFRDGAVYVVNRRQGNIIYEAPPAELVTGLVGDLMAGVSSEALSPPERAALVHAGTAGIHPFRDGNGRTARVLASLAMYRGGFRRPEFTSLEEWWGAHPADYYAAFRALGPQWDPDANVTPFVQVHVRAQLEQVRELDLRISAERELWTALENVAADVGQPRLIDALYDAFFGRAVTNRYFREVADVTAVTAAQDLARLASAGFVEVHGRGRSTEYLGTSLLARRVAEEARLGPDFPEGALPDQQRAWIMSKLRDRVARR
jgi:Fic family protein